MKFLAIFALIIGIVTAPIIYFAVQHDKACIAAGGVVVRGACFNSDVVIQLPKPGEKE